MPIGGAVNGSNWQHGTHGATSSLTDFTGKMISAELKSSRDKKDATVWGSSQRIYESGFKDYTISAVYHYDDTVSGQLWDIYDNDDVVNFQLGPNGITTGKLKFTGTAQIDSISDPIQVDSLMQITVEFSPASAVTKGTFS